MGSIKLEGHQKTVLSVMPKATDWVYPPSKSSFSFLFFFPVTVGVVVRRQKDSDGQEVLGLLLGGSDKNRHQQYVETCYVNE
jgi:hypothetical protein